MQIWLLASNPHPSALQASVTQGLCLTKWTIKESINPLRERPQLQNTLFSKQVQPEQSRCINNSVQGKLA